MKKASIFLILLGILLICYAFFFIKIDDNFSDYDDNLALGEKVCFKYIEKEKFYIDNASNYYYLYSDDDTIVALVLDKNLNSNKACGTVREIPLKVLDNISNEISNNYYIDESYDKDSSKKNLLIYIGISLMICGLFFIKKHS